MSHPSTTSAYGIWSLNQIRDAQRGSNWPPLVELPSNAWELTSPIADLKQINENGTSYTGANMTQALVTSIFESNNFQDTSITDLSRSNYAIYLEGASGESVSIDYYADGATSVTLRVQRWSGIDVNYTLSGDVSGSGTAGSGSSTITSNCPSNGTITLTTTNSSNGMGIYAIQFNNKSPGDLTYVT